MKIYKSLFLFLFSFILFSSCNNSDKIEPLIDADVQAEREELIIQQYLTENNLTAQRNDLGIYYIVLEEGTGTTTPNDGASVIINYEGSVLYGNTFDSSYEKKEPLAFTFGEGSVLTGFEQAVKQMKVGEKTLFFIPSRYAYGQSGIVSGSREIIPPFATLVFEIKREI